jgi:hypothetical protein
MAVVACCTTSWATRLTRASGEPPPRRFAAVLFFAGRLAAGRLTAGRLAELERVEVFFPVDFLAADFFAPDFFPADPLLWADFAVGRCAEDFFADFLADFFADFFADFVPLERDFDAERLLLVLLPDFLRDFLARVAMILLLGVGGEIRY